MYNLLHKVIFMFTVLYINFWISIKTAGEKTKDEI